MSLFLSYAHPDDESFFTAGVARQVADAGGEVVLCCATRGDRGSAGDPPLVSREELPARREQELCEAAALLGIARVEFLPYHDRQLAEAPPAEIRAALVMQLRRHRPAVVVTFEPNGGNLHPDHVAISRFTQDAVTAAADPRWHPELGAPHEVPRLLWVGTVLPWDETDPERLAAHPGVDFLVDIRPQRELKARALATHRTQHQSIGRVFLDRPDRDAILSWETFRLASGPAPEERPAGDLFAGLPGTLGGGANGPSRLFDG
jgi:N-acetylglucosamine malate deacetylase 2